jgi:hypothetical protein
MARGAQNAEEQIGAVAAQAVANIYVKRQHRLL